MFSIHFIYIWLLFLNIYFIDSVRFQKSVRILFTLNKVPSWIFTFIYIILIIIINIGFKTQMAAGYVQNLTSVNLHIYGYVSLEISKFMFLKLQWFVFVNKIKNVGCWN